MNSDPRANRHYDTSPLSTLTIKESTLPDQDLLLKLYQEVCNSWRMLTDVRFKLLGLIPAISGIILISLLSDKSDGLSPLARTVVAVFGMFITLALLI